MPPLKVCLITDFFLPGVGGVEYVVHFLAEALVRQGCQVNVLAPTAPGDEVGYRVSLIKDFKLPNFRENARKKRELDYRLSLGMVYTGFRFDIINAHFVYPAGYAAVIWGKSNRVPVTVTTHGVDVQRIPELSYGLTYDFEIREKTSCTLELADLVTSPSKALLDASLHLYHDPKKNLLIPHGIDPAFFESGFSRCLPPPYIVYLGRLQEVKGVRLLLEAFKRVSGSCPGLKLVIIGDGEEKPALVGQSLNGELSGKVLFMGTLTGKEKINWLKGAEMLVCPSFTEAFGIAVLEAMALGLPVVGFDTSGINELIEHEVSGLLAPKYNTRILADQIIRLVKDKKLAGRIGKINRRISLKFHWDIIAERYLEAYNKAI